MPLILMPMPAFAVPYAAPRPAKHIAIEQPRALKKGWKTSILSYVAKVEACSPRTPDYMIYSMS
jgi:hypothetical protein